MKGRNAVRFDGVPNASLGDYLRGTGDVGIPNAFTAFMVYSASAYNADVILPWNVGVPGGTYGACRNDAFVNGEMYFSSWAYNYGTGFIVPTNTARLWVDRFDTNMTQIEMFDSTANSHINFTQPTSGESAPDAGYYVGGLDPSVGNTAYPYRFAGDISELIIYRGYLNDADRTAVEQYLSQKYLLPAPVSYQWRVNGVPISGATNSTLTVQNVQQGNAGTYAVVVTNSGGSTTSSGAVLTVGSSIYSPAISQQPQSQTANVGADINLQVTAIDSQSIALPSTPSGTLQLWLTADAGVVTNSSGQVSQWKDQSGNTNDATQAASALQPQLVSSDVMFGRKALRFDGIPDASKGDYLHGVGDVGIPDAFTSFMVYSANSIPDPQILPWLVGVPGGTYGSCRDDFIGNGELYFSGWADDYDTGFHIQTNTARIWTDRLSTNLTSADVTDINGSGRNTVTLATTGLSAPAAGYYVGGVDPSVGFTHYPYRFAGDMSEVLVYRGYLTDTDRLAVEQYLSQKYLMPSSPGPFAYQWLFNGNPIANATNSTFQLQNVQVGTSGTYSVIVSNSFGATASSNAVVNVTPPPPPLIVQPPTSQNVTVGGTATFSVSTANSGAPLPAVGSGTLRLWLKGDAGVVTNGNGQVSQWQDQSGNANDATQSNSNMQPKLVNPAALNGMPALRFDGVASPTLGDCMQGTGDVGLSNAYTSFMVYLLQNASNSKQVPAYIGFGTTAGNSRAYFIYNDEMRWGTYYYDYGNGFLVPTNSYRIATHRLNTNENSFQQFDATATSSNSFSLVPNNPLVTPPPGYGIGALNTPDEFGFNFAGDIAELIYYRGALTDSDRQAVEAYLKERYLLPSSQGPFTYQWMVNSTSIPGATNSTVTLTNVQLSDAGTYSVVVTDVSGSTTSSNAVLNVGFAPSITTQPPSQTVVQSNSVAFSVTATGTDPLAYQWYFNNAAIAGATASTLALTNVQTYSSGGYSVVVSNTFGTATSSNVVLQVDAPPQITSQPQGVFAAVGSTVTVNATAVDGAAPALPAVSSGTLRLWLKGDAGVVANGAGQVSLWRDQSPNANDATQSNTAQQPVVVYPAGANGRPALRFDGVESSTTGDFMQGTGDVGLSNAFTAFLYYAENSTFDSYGYGKDVAFVGVPNPSYTGTARGFAVVNNKLTFTTWGNDYLTSVNLPVGSYRIATERFNTNQNFAEVFDRTLTNSNGFTFSTSGQSVPGAGYYIGGLGSQIRNFGGDIGDVIYYSGALTDNDRLAVEQYLQQKYYQAAVTTGLSYQWQLNGTDVPGQTNSSLVITNVQFSDAGTYDLVVTNSAGSTTSSNAVVIVGLAPSISSQPQTQSVPVGAPASFAVTVSGTDPLTYQWKFNGTNIASATTSTLTITNAQTSNNGNYTVVITNLFGAVTSSNAVLRVDIYPQILSQPQSATIIDGNNATFSVGTDAVLPAVTSGTLRLWLKADVGVVTNANNQVSRWVDQSPNGNSANQANTAQQPLLVRPAAINGRPALRFDGFPSSSSGDYLLGTNDVGLTDAYTSFVVAEPSSFSQGGNVPAFVGSPGTTGAARDYALVSGQLYFSTWANDYASGFFPQAGTYRIWTERFNTNRTFAEMFDRSASTSTNFSWTVSNTQTPAAQYYIGGLGAFTRNFAGDIAEVIYYKGSLTDTDRVAVESYLSQKYYQALPLTGLTYQWQFNGINITDATNSTLTVSNAQPASAGAYTVVVCNGSACMTSSNATLTVNVPPFITQQPVDENVIVGSSASFSANGDGTGPLSYQWRHNGANIAGATTTSLSITSAQQSDAGSYALVVSSPYGSTTSSNAVLSVTTSTLIVGNVTGSGSSTIQVPVSLFALGTENALGFSLNFDPTLLSISSIALGADASGATIFANTNQQSSGRAGVIVSFNSGGTFAAGTQQVALVTFNVGIVATNTVTPITFGDSPTVRQISDSLANSLPATFVAGSATLSQTVFEGDLSPRPNGDQRVTITDWVQVGRFVAGLDSVGSPSEFQRADCAPLGTLGNGQLTVSDWVQAGRYAVGLDPLTPVGGPTTAMGNVVLAPKIPTSRAITLQTTATSGATNVVSVELNAQGNESAVGFSLTFDSQLVQFTGAKLGSGASGATLNVNAAQAINGTIGIALELPFGQTFAVGTQEVVRLSFIPVAYSPGSSNLTFTDSPVIREVSDASANTLLAAYVSSTLSTTGLLPSLTITQDGSGNVTLTWPAAANGYGLESVSDLSTNWQPVATAVVTNGANVFLTQPAATNQLYFRLRHP